MNFHRRCLAAAMLVWPAYSLAQSCGKSTPRQTEGPFFKPQSPERNVLVEGKPAALLVTGRVLGADCKPVAHALLDFWHADEKGEYDNRGFRYRGTSSPMPTGAIASRPSCPRNIRAARGTSM